MGVKRRRLINLGKRQPHFVGQRDEMIRREAAIFILDEMEILNQQIPLPGAVPQQRQNVAMGVGVELPPLRMNCGAGTSRAGVGKFTGLVVAV